MVLSDKAEKCQEIYESTFDASCYLYGIAKHCDDYYERFFNTQTYKAFTQAKGKRQMGPRCVDIGSGPTVHRLAMASKYCEVLYASDFVKANREAVEEFLGSSTKIAAHTTLIKTIAEIEGFENLDEGANVIERRLKAKLKGALYCDVLKRQPLGDLEVLGDLFDVVISSGCLETACTSLKEFRDGLQNLSSLLNPGGALILMTYLGEDYYETGDVAYPCIPVHQDTVEEGLREAGFEIETVVKEADPRGNHEKSSNCEGYLFVLAYKSEDGQEE